MGSSDVCVCLPFFVLILEINVKMLLEGPFLMGVIRIVQTTDLPDFEVISDLQTTYQILMEKNYVLDFINGATTLRAFKELFLLEKDIWFRVSNLELFIYKMRQFKYYHFEIVSCHDEVVDRRARAYKDIEVRLMGKCNERGMGVSLWPNAFASIRTSLCRPDMYLFERNISTIIYEKLGKQLRYEELRRDVQNEWRNYNSAVKEKEVRDKTKYKAFREEKPIMDVNDFDTQFDKSLRSLLFAGVISEKKGYFSIRDVILKS